MKRLYACPFHLFLILLFTAEGFSAKLKIPIGGIFHEGNEETEVAFRSATYRLNMYNPTFELVPISQFISSTDSFKTWKAVCNLTEHGVAAIFGPFSPITSHVSGSISGYTEIPNIHGHWDTNTLDYEMVINLYPDPSTLSDAILTIVEWTSYVIIYDTDAALIRLNSLLQKHKPEDPAVTVRQLSPDGDYRPLFKELRNHTVTKIVLDCEPDIIIEVLKQAKLVGMLGEYHSYIIPSLEIHTLDFSDFKDDSINITALRLVRADSPEMKDVVRDWQQGELAYHRILDISASTVKTETALAYDAVILFHDAVQKMLMSDDAEEFQIRDLKCGQLKKRKRKKGLLDYMKEIKLESGLTGPVKLDENGRRTDFNIEITELDLLGDKFEPVAIWNSLTDEIEHTRTDESMASKIAENIHNKMFRVASRIGAPYLTNAKSKDGKPLQGNDQWEGYSMDLIQMIADELGFQFEFYIVKDGKYGSIDPVTKQWDGLVKELLEGRADLAICDLTMTSDRRGAVDFTMPFMSLGISILFIKGENIPPGLFSFLNPFHTNVWIFTAAAYLGISLLIYVVARLAPDEWENPHPCNQQPEELENIWNLLNCMWLTMGSIMCQGCDLLPKAKSVRVVTGMWWFFALIMANSYMANLAAFLTQNQMGVEIKDATSLAMQTQVKYGAVIGGSTLSFFKNSKDPIYQRMWSSMESASPSVFTDDNDKGMNRVLKSKSKYAFLMESTSLTYLKHKDCKLKQIGNLLDSKGYGIALPKDSRYRTVISGQVLRLKESGKLNELKTKWWEELNEGKDCDEEAEEEPNSNQLGIKNVGGVFVILMAGCGVAVIIGAIEFMWNIRTVAVNEKITTMEAFKAEFFFAMKFWITTKPVQPVLLTESNEVESFKSINSRPTSISRFGDKVELN